ncbi:Hypothetical predicted protein, partial [Lecanosticta acicola]
MEDASQREHAEGAADEIPTRFGTDQGTRWCQLLDRVTWHLDVEKDDSEGRDDADARKLEDVERTLDWVLEHTADSILFVWFCTSLRARCSVLKLNPVQGDGSILSLEPRGGLEKADMCDAVRRLKAEMVWYWSQMDSTIKLEPVDGAADFTPDPDLAIGFMQDPFLGQVWFSACEEFDSAKLNPQDPLAAQRLRFRIDEAEDVELEIDDDDEAVDYASRDAANAPVLSGGEARARNSTINYLRKIAKVPAHQQTLLKKGTLQTEDGSQLLEGLDRDRTQVEGLCRIFATPNDYVGKVGNMRSFFRQLQMSGADGYQSIFCSELYPWTVFGVTVMACVAESSRKILQRKPHLFTDSMRTNHRSQMKDIRERMEKCLQLFEQRCAQPTLEMRLVVMRYRVVMRCMR